MTNFDKLIDDMCAAWWDAGEMKTGNQQPIAPSKTWDGISEEWKTPYRARMYAAFRAIGTDEDILKRRIEELSEMCRKQRESLLVRGVKL
jgi:rubredoxin